METIQEVRAEYPFSIVVGVELTQASGYALDQAERIARRIPGSQVHAVHVIPRDPGEARRRELLSLVRLYVTEKIEAVGGSDGQIVGAHLRIGLPEVEIASVATDVHAELILVGTHNPAHMKSLFVGTVGERLMRTAMCPVLVVGPPPKPPKREPEIEPPCPDCVAMRFESHGRDWWCARHGLSYTYRRVQPASPSGPPPPVARVQEQTPTQAPPR